MVVNNWLNYKLYMSSHAATNTHLITDIGCVDFYNNTATVWVCINNSSYLTYVGRNFAIYTYMGAVVGTGTDTPTIEDYCLGNDVTSSFTGFECTQTSSIHDGVVTNTYVIKGTNATSSTITLTEVGIYKKLWNENGEDRYNSVLMIRELLPSPLEVQSGQQFTITLVWQDG